MDSTRRTSLVLTFLGISNLLLSGCAALESRIAVLGIRQESRAFDLSSHAGQAGMLLLRCRPPAQQVGLDHYEFFVDEEGPYVVSKYSESEITLDPGGHTLRIVAVTSDYYRRLIPVREFGRAAVEAFDIAAGSKLVLEYMGPYWDWSRGKLSEKKE